jgi:uncharacterized protein YdeI (BOF family)
MMAEQRSEQRLKMMGEQILPSGFVSGPTDSSVVWREMSLKAQRANESLVCLTCSDRTGGGDSEVQPGSGFILAGGLLGGWARPVSWEDFVNKKFALLSFIAAFAIAIVSWGGLAQAQQSGSAAQPATQTQQPQTQEPQTQPPDTQAPANDQGAQQPGQAQPQQQAPDQSAQADPSGSREFVGTVVKQGDKYMFQDAASGTTYDIDHQDEVKKFDGKKVRVHGTLDPNGKMIHVQ